MGLPWILDKWHDSRPQCRISVQVLMLSGESVQDLAMVRVSTDQNWLVIEMPMCDFFERPDFAFDTFLLHDGNRDEVENILRIHPKTVARKRSVANIKERNHLTSMYFEQRIPLPRKCRHRFADSSDDNLFFGKKIVRYPGGAVHLHVELIGESSDAYKAYKDSPVVTNAYNNPLPNANMQASEVPVTVNVEFGGGEDMSRDGHSVTNEQEKPSSPVGQAVILQNQYEGAAFRTRSVKSAKRTPTTQD